MHITRLTTENFRNLQDVELLPCQEVNVIYGGNAQGKTNLLEALWLFTGGHSFRGAKDAELPKLSPQGGANVARASLSLEFFSEGRMQGASLFIENGRRSSIINGVKKKTGSALVGKMRSVIFSPEHLLLIKEGPARRRSFIDGALCQLKPGYAGLLGIFQRALLQRNALLKDLVRFPELTDTLGVWDARFAKLGGEVMAERAAYIQRLAPKVQDVYSGISKGREALALAYAPAIKTDGPFDGREAEQALLQELARTRRSDIRAGFTTAGPHRDDLEITLDGISARAYGSQGQQRSAVLALKLAEAEALSQLTGEAPVVLLDDVMSELDQSRQDYLLNHLHGRQVFITCCSPETVSRLETGRRFKVEAGRVEAEEV